MTKLPKQTHLWANWPQEKKKKKERKKKKINTLLAGLGSVRIGKNSDIGLENATLGLRPQSQFFPIRASQQVSNIYLLYG